MDQVEAGRRYWRFAVPIELSFSDICNSDPGPVADLNIVELRFEAVARERRIIFWYAYPNNPELALKLKAAFLPGQLGEVRRREREAYWRGVFLAPPV